MIDKALNFGVEGTVEEEAEILGRRRRQRTEGQQAKDARDVEKDGDAASVLSSLSSSSSESEEEGCLEKIPGWLGKLQDKLQEPFLPDIELRSYHWES